MFCLLSSLNSLFELNVFEKKKDYLKMLSLFFGIIVIVLYE